MTAPHPGAAAGESAPKAAKAPKDAKPRPGSRCSVRRCRPHPRRWGGRERGLPPRQGRGLAPDATGEEVIGQGRAAQQVGEVGPAEGNGGGGKHTHTLDPGSSRFRWAAATKTQPLGTVA